MQPKHGFTLIEVVVVFVVAALLIGVLLPTLGMSRRRAYQAKSLANTRSWGEGTMTFASNRKHLLPWEGEKRPDHGTWTAPHWWANAVPDYLSRKTYLELAEGRDIPLPGSDSFFVDGGAALPGIGQPGGPGPYTSAGLPYFFCYVYNSKLDSDSSFVPPGYGTPAGEKRMSLDQIREPGSTVLMLEKRTVLEEVPADDALDGIRDAKLDVAFGDWEEFAGRYDRGGHILFGDGHGAHVTLAEANRVEPTDHVDPSGAGRNKPDLIWNPLGRGD